MFFVHIDVLTREAAFIVPYIIWDCSMNSVSIVTHCIGLRKCLLQMDMETVVFMARFPYLS